MTPERMEEIRTALDVEGWEPKAVAWIEECFKAIDELRNTKPPIYLVVAESHDGEEPLSAHWEEKEALAARANAQLNDRYGRSIKLWVWSSEEGTWLR